MHYPSLLFGIFATLIIIGLGLEYGQILEMKSDITQIANVIVSAHGAQ